MLADLQLQAFCTVAVRWTALGLSAAEPRWAWIKSQAAVPGSPGCSAAGLLSWIMMMNQVVITGMVHMWLVAALEQTLRMIPIMETATTFMQMIFQTLNPIKRQLHIFR